ncbi:hypothetical protein NQ317_013560 [Molorchus minor]|uniref:Telomere-length maintenance and DNA damage repair domain-containing protein n=1 Tax=Molorchus minor TaxID=1323400 RepID=A0ABQ9JK27_9CUCU|nr:hypothetical protein NQ317_013560 [Molorchus minor]
MSLRNELENWCIHLESSRVTERKRSCEKLSDLLENDGVLKILNQGSSVSWKDLISAIQECLRKDADKVSRRHKKKGTVNIKYPSAELFLQIIKTSTREADNEINVSNLIGYIIGCMKDPKMKTCYDKTFFLILKEYILVNSRCRGRLHSEDWTELFKLFKKLSEEKFENLVLKCFMLIIKWGPSSGLQPNVLREEFEFITKICLQISQNTPMNQQEDVLDIVLDFCRHTAKDNRVSCCKLGEDVISNFLDLYERNGCEAKIKRQLVEFFLLQVQMHHPSGVPEGHSCAYAVNWATWKRCIKMVYSLLREEIRFYFMYHHKNGSFFLRKGVLVTLCKKFSTLFVEVSHQLFVSPELDVTMTLNCSSISQGSQKRQKLDISLKCYINNIQETKSWLWIHIVSSIIEAYPELITADNYLALLQILSALQIESNDYNNITNIFCVFGDYAGYYG